MEGAALVNKIALAPLADLARRIQEERLLGPLWPEDDHIALLDQTRLPFVRDVLQIHSPDEMAAAIRQMQICGSGPSAVPAPWGPIWPCACTPLHDAATYITVEGSRYVTSALVTNMGAGLSAEGPDLQRHRAVTQANLPRFKRLAVASLAAPLRADKIECDS